MESFIYRVGSRDHRIGRPPLFYHSRDLIPSGCQFTSVYAVREEDAQALMEAGTVAGFKGIVWSRRLWVDFDETEPANRAEEFLKKEGYDYVAYDTGGRGRHIGVLRAAVPSHLLPAQDKQWVTEFLPGADMGLYWHLHLLRLPGAVHERTGRRKQLIGRHGERELILPPLSEQPVSSGSTSPLAGGPPRESIFKVWEVASRLTPDPDTNRHDQIRALAVALRKEGRVTFDEAMWVTLEMNRGFAEPKEVNEVLRIVRWAFGLEG